METSSGIQASLAGRYATALFGLARDEKTIDAVGASLDSLDRALAESVDFAALVSSPLVGRADAAQAVAAIARELKLDPTTANFLGVLAGNGRLSALKQVIVLYRRLAAEHRGEASAQVTSAHALSEPQLAALKAKLKARLGRDVAVETAVDPSLLGGIVVRLGSQMIDASIKTKLNTLAQAMKG